MKSLSERDARPCKNPPRGLRATSRRILFLLAGAACVVSHGFGQGAPRSAHLALVARADRDSVVLRWGISTAGGWITGNKAGYLVERVTFKADGNPERRTPERLTAVPLTPWPLEEWKRRSPRDNTYAAIAAQTLYGKTFIPRAMDEKAMNALKNAADELSNRYSFAHFVADNDALTAEGLALRFVDRSVRSGGKYLYRVFPAAKDSTYSLDTAYVLVDAIAFEQAGAPPGLSATGLEGRIELEWKDPEGLSYSGYYVSRSEDGGRTFKQLTKTPLVTVTPDGATEKAHPRFLDTSVVNYLKYKYRVCGVTPFAERSKPATVESYGRDLTAPPPPLARIPKQLSKNSVLLEWEMQTPPGDLAGFVIARSANSLTGFARITGTPLPPAARRFVDPQASEDEPYYLIGALDTAGNMSRSLPVYSILIDSLPPAVPKGLQGTIDTNGVVRLHWRLGPERSILGYRVLWSNDPAHEFSQATPEPVRDTTFVDTVNVNTLSRYVFYRIAAVSTRFAHSEMSPVLALRRPDRFPPEAPVFNNYLVSDSTVWLSWFGSTSNDVAYERLQRRTAGVADWKTIATLRGRQTDFTDRAVAKRTVYEYKIEAVDSSGLVSRAPSSLFARPFDSGARPGPQGLQGSYTMARKSVVLRWLFSATQSEKFWFVVYRAYGSGGLIKYSSVAQKERGFEDRGLVGPGKYRYAIRVITEKGGESVLSPGVEVEVK